jgi:RNA polymerase sigma-70 factor (ECF subfamily)
MDESALNQAMDRYACGDASAFSLLHRALFPRLLGYLARMSSSAAVADDLVQETFLRMHRARSTFARGGAVLPWAYAIARNVHIDHARAARLRETERLPSDPGPETMDRAAPDAESSAIAAETARAVERVLARIPGTQREAFVLLRYEGMSVQDAAAVLGTTTTAVKLRAFRAYEALRQELRDLHSMPAGTEDRHEDEPSVTSAGKARSAGRRAPGGGHGRS